MENRVLVPDIWELEMHGVAEPGAANKERIYLRAAIDIELGEYFLMTGWRWPDGAALPLQDTFWLPRGVRVAAGYWVIVYTGSGEQKMTTLTTGEPCLVLHWGKQTTLFNLPQIVPVLFRIGGIMVGHHLPQNALAQ
jgi:hypothetical protein